MIRPGDPFPRFSLLDENSEILGSSALEGVRHLAFACPEESMADFACGLSAIHAKLMLRNIPAIGIGPGGPEGHAALKGAGARAKLLSDPGSTVLEAMGLGPSDCVVALVGRDGLAEAVWIGPWEAGLAGKALEKAVSLSRG